MVECGFMYISVVFIDLEESIGFLGIKVVVDYELLDIGVER